MKFKAAFASLFLLIISPAQATIVNFIGLTESAGGYGEGAWSSLPITTSSTNLWVTGHSWTDDDNTQYAYLDWGNAGVGVCKDVIDPTLVDTVHPGRKPNNCNPGNDDNTTQGEYLQFVFDTRVFIKNIWFNNNHDGGLVAGDKVTIGSTQYGVSTGYAGGAHGIGGFTVNAYSPLDIEYYNKQFYISGIEFVDVAEPNSTVVFALGLLSLLYARRKNI